VIFNQAWQLDGLEVKMMIDSSTFVVGAMWGAREGCELPQLCGLRGHVWLNEWWYEVHECAMYESPFSSMC